MIAQHHKIKHMWLSPMDRGDKLPSAFSYTTLPLLECARVERVYKGIVTLELEESSEKVQGHILLGSL